MAAQIPISAQTFFFPLLLNVSVTQTELVKPGGTDTRQVDVYGVLIDFSLSNVASRRSAQRANVMEWDVCSIPSVSSRRTQRPEVVLQPG